MYDVVWTLRIANLTGVDLETSFARNAAVNKVRDWSGPNDGGLSLARHA